MNRSGCILNEIGMGPLMDRLIYMYIGPLCTAVYPRLLSEGFEAHHSFIVAYSPDTDSGLGVHDDNSEVTINVALSDDYDGASLAMYHHARVITRWGGVEIDLTPCQFVFPTRTKTPCGL